MGIYIGALVSIVLIHFYLYIILKKDVSHSRRFILYAGIYLLVFKTLDIIHGISGGNWTKIPVEYSTVLYILLPISVFANWHRIKPFAVIGSFIAGSTYVFYFIFTVKFMIEGNGLYHVATAFINHTLLYLMSVCIMKEKVYDRKQTKSIMMYSLALVFYAIVLSVFIDFSSVYRFIFIILKLEVLYYIWPNMNPSLLTYLLFYVLVGLVYYWLVRFSFFINQKVYQKKHQDAFSFEEIEED